jgi:hypothetical protein
MRGHKRSQGRKVCAEGFLERPPRDFGEVRVLDLSKGSSFMRHIVPTEQFVHLIDKEGECLCGPDVEQVRLADGELIAKYVHHPLEKPDQFDYAWM